MLRKTLIAIFVIGIASTVNAQPPGVRPDASISDLIKLITKQQEQIALLTQELTALKGALIVKPSVNDGTADAIEGGRVQLLIDPESNVPVLAHTKWIIQSNGNEQKMVPIWRNGTYLPIDVVMNPADKKPRQMEIYRGGQQSIQTFQNDTPRIPQRRETQ